MIFKLVWENVRFRPVRTFLSILLIAVPVTLILTLVGMSRGFLEDSARRAQGVGADILLRPPGSSLMSFSGAPIPEKLVNQLATEPHVVAATGIVMQLIGTSFDSVNGIDPAAFAHLAGPFVYLAGHGLEKPDDILIDQYYANQSHLTAGGKLNVLNRPWNIAGVVEPGKLAHLFVDIHVLQNLIGATGKISQVYIKLDDPRNTTAVIDYLKNRYEGYPAYSMRDLASYYSVSNIPLLQGFIRAVMGIGVVIGFTVVSLSMYMAVLQRTREIGILKSLGASKRFIMAIILVEAGVLGLGGSIGGILLSFVSRWAIQQVLPASLPAAIVPSWWPIAGSIALGAALLGALYPGMLAIRQDPIEALAYE